MIAEGKVSAKDFPDLDTESGFKKPQKDFIDNIVYDGKAPNEYLKKFKIGLKNKDMM